MRQDPLGDLAKKIRERRQRCQLPRREQLSQIAYSVGGGLKVPVSGWHLTERQCLVRLYDDGLIPISCAAVLPTMWTLCDDRQQYVLHALRHAFRGNVLQRDCGASRDADSTLPSDRALKGGLTTFADFIADRHGSRGQRSVRPRPWACRVAWPASTTRPAARVLTNLGRATPPYGPRSKRWG